MRIWRLCRAVYAAGAFDGEGARRFGGRWNSRGVPMVYCSTSLALAAMELFVHLEPNQQPEDLVTIAAELPEGEPAERMETAKLPAKWRTGDYAPLRAIGDAWILEKRSLAMMVPSAALHEEWNVLVNPLHPRAGEIRIEAPQPFQFDARMFR
jgi:RES domain-containing protein